MRGKQLEKERPPLLSRSRDTLTGSMRIGIDGLARQKSAMSDSGMSDFDRVTLAYPGHIRNPDFFAIAGRTRSQAGCPQWREGAGGKGGNLGFGQDPKSQDISPHKRPMLRTRGGYA